MKKIEGVQKKLIGIYEESLSSLSISEKQCYLRENHNYQEKSFDIVSQVLNLAVSKNVA